MRLLFFLVTAFLFLTTSASAQNLTGIWRGYFVTENYDQYKFELQIEQNKNSIAGVSYSYHNTSFYGKAKLTGLYNKTAKAALIQEIRTVEVRMSGSNSAVCIMKCSFQYARSGNEEFLEGTYTSTYEKSNPEEGIRKGGNCGGGKIYLRKVTTSDFYVEPFLRDKPVARRTVPPAGAPARKPAVARTSPAKPEPSRTTPPPVTAKRTTPRPPATNTEGKKEPEVVRTSPKIETEKTAIAVPQPRKMEEVKPFVLPKVTRSRENALAQTITVRSGEVEVKLYDNGEIDGDTISVYLDNKLVLQSKRLSTTPLTITLKLDESDAEHVLVMVAENMGRIPPNTSLMIVNDGDKRYQVHMTSTEQKNAMVRFRYQKKS